MVEYDSCGLQNMISADAEVRAMLTALAGKIRSCKTKHVAPEDDEAEIGKDPFVSPTAHLGGRRPCPSNLRRNTGGIADEGEPLLRITINTSEGADEGATLSIPRANDDADQGCGDDIRDRIFDIGE